MPSLFAHLYCPRESPDHHWLSAGCCPHKTKQAFKQLCPNSILFLKKLNIAYGPAILLLDIHLRYTLKRVIVYPCSQENYPQEPQALVPSIVFFVSLDVIRLGTSSEWDHAGCVLLCRTYFTEHNVLKVHPGCGRCQAILPS